MRVQRIEVEGHRGIRRIDWSPADLTLLVGEAPAIEAVAEAVFALSQAPRGWSDLGAYVDGLALPQQRVPEGEEAPTTRWRLTCLPSPDADDPRRAEYELGIYPPSAGLPWEVRYEFLRRADEFGDLDLLHREGSSAELRLSPRGGARPKPSRVTVARDMSALGASDKLFDDPAVRPFAQPLALWSRHRRFDVSAGSPARAASLFPSFDERLVERGDNLINALQNLADLARTRPLLDELLGLAVPGHESLRFPMRGDGTASLAHRIAGVDHAPPELPDHGLRALCVAAAVLATSPPPLVWFDADVWDLPATCFPAVARALRALARRAQVALDRPPAELVARLREAPAPGEPAPAIETVEVTDGPDGVRLERAEPRADTKGFLPG